MSSTSLRPPLRALLFDFLAYFLHVDPVHRVEHVHPVGPFLHPRDAEHTEVRQHL